MDVDTIVSFVIQNGQVTESGAILTCAVMLIVRVLTSVCKSSYTFSCIFLV